MLSNTEINTELFEHLIISKFFYLLNVDNILMTKNTQKFLNFYRIEQIVKTKLVKLVSGVPFFSNQLTLIIISY